MHLHPLVIVWRVTEECDLGCPFCGYSHHLCRSRAAADPAQVVAFGRLLGEYARRAGREVLVSFIGGEPFRWPALLDTARAFSRDFGLRVGATTNGTALASPAVRQRIAGEWDEITLSLDGLQDAHDCSRGAPGLFGRLGAALEDLRERKAQAGRGPLLRANALLTRESLHGFEALCCWLAEHGVQELSFNALGGRERPEFYPEHCLQPEDASWLREELPAIRARMAQKGLSILGSERYLERIARAGRPAGEPAARCRPGEKFLFLTEDGLAGPCSFTDRELGVPLERLRTPGDLQDLPGCLAARRNRLAPVACASCPSTQVSGKFAPGGS